MAWEIESGADKLDKYEWKASSNDEEQVLTDTVAPGDINVKPEDMSLVPTLAPTTTGIQSGVWKWGYENTPDNGWYVRGASVED